MVGERGLLASSRSGPSGTNPTTAGSCTTSIQPSLTGNGVLWVSSGPHHNQNESHHKHPGNNKGKGKSHVNGVEGDGFANVVGMEVDRFNDPDVFHEAPMIENWKFNVEDTGMNAAGPVAGPFSSFRSSSLPPWV